MSRQLFYSIAILVGGTLIAALLIWLRPDPVEQERIEKVPLVEVVPLQEASGPIPVLASGTVQALDEVTVAAEISGRLTYVNPDFREGGTLAEGETLFRIERSDYLNQVRVAQADVAVQAVAVLEAEEEVAIAREELERFAARGGQAGSLTAGENAILPPRQIEETQAQASAGPSAQAEAAAPSGLATREPQLASAKAQRDRAEATLADAKLRLARTIVRAPFDGLVRAGDLAAGQLVQPGEVLGSLVSTSAYEVRISLTGDEAALIPGLLEPVSERVTAEVTTSYGGKAYRWPAFVARTSAILDEATRNIEVFIRVPSPLKGGRALDETDPASAPPLLLGAFVDVAITGASLDSYAEVPADAVRPGNQIWVVRDGKLAILDVRVIQRSDETAYIVSPDLIEGDRLITSSLTAAIDGLQLRVAGAE
jgi:RND family efflux transporter MFP subunit